VNNVTYFKSCVTLSGIDRITFEKQIKNHIMPLITILIVLIVVGVVLWLVNSYIPMDHKISRIINIVVVIVVVIWLLKVFGLFSYLTNITV
jgi:hypothetical protein